MDRLRQASRSDMSTLSKKLRSVGNDTHSGIMHWCSGCNEAHVIWTKAPAGRPTWTWNNNVDRPTCSPSVRCFTSYDDDGEPLGVERTLCHYFLEDGRLKFCSDSLHSLAGQTVDLPDFPNGDEL